ncbi:uncharacterized protein Bfra_002035 [Botrytis fragariae]|uniref:Uncharacterized protein n=1 Tax=Botrytis fragariae TaxID=1964551 RepID=A0A8H6EMG2_9HELO|nr:uncharacterized protein Bfra_002035 [Botrytis fragariae]KAF5877668.1 hypothetical protein Bfra_002035 [Botrytis fragariae]
MTTPKNNFKWNCATPCFVSKSRHLATSIYGSEDIDERRSTGLPDADYSAAFETTEVRRCFGKIYEAHSQVIKNKRGKFPTTWVYPDYTGCGGTATSPGLFTLPMAWNSDTIDSGDQRQGNRRTFSTRDNSSTTPSVQEKAMFEAISEVERFEKSSPTMATREPQAIPSTTWAGLDEEVCPNRARKRISRNMRMRLDRKAAAQILVSEHTSQKEDICLQVGICSHVSHSNKPLASIEEMSRE